MPKSKTFTTSIATRILNASASGAAEDDRKRARILSLAATATLAVAVMAPTASAAEPVAETTKAEICEGVAAQVADGARAEYMAKAVEFCAGSAALAELAMADGVHAERVQYLRAKLEKPTPTVDLK